MNAENLHDAISLLPEEMVADVDRLRRKKRFPWRSLTAVAACLCLLVGLWSIFPGGIKMAADSANGSGMDHFAESITMVPLEAYVVDVQEDRIIVLPGSEVTDIAQPVTVLLTELTEVPPLQAEQKVRIYCYEEGDPLVPYRIEIIEN